MGRCITWFSHRITLRIQPVHTIHTTTPVIPAFCIANQVTTLHSCVALGIFETLAWRAVNTHAHSSKCCQISSSTTCTVCRIDYQFGTHDTRRYLLPYSFCLAVRSLVGMYHSGVIQNPWCFLLCLLRFAHIILHTGMSINYR